MNKEEVAKYEAKIKKMKTSDLIILATLLNLTKGLKFKQKGFLILQELDERGIL